MASLIDVQNDPGDLVELEKTLRQAVTEPKEESTEGQQQQATEPQNNDPLKGTKFEGKSVEDIIASYNNLQSAYGRMANDLGQQRALTDRLLDLKRADDLQRNAPQPYKLESAELLSDPATALDKYLESREGQRNTDVTEKLTRLEASLAEQRFTAKHPDFAEVGGSAEFQQWVFNSPSRARVGQMAANGDFEAADALLTEYKQAKPAPQPQQQQDNSANIEAARQAGLEKSSQGADQGSSKGRIYRRADLIDLKIRKPHVYEDPAFQDEILKAYAEGRVK